MFKITQEDKVLISKLIRYYRLEKAKANPRFAMTKFIYDKHKNYICSVSYYSRVERGEYLASDDIYFSLMENLDLHYYHDEKLNVILRKINISLGEATQVNNIKKIHSVLTTAMNILEEYEEYVIYKEYKELYCLIHEYYIHQRYQQNLIDKYYSFLEILPKQLRPIIITITYQFYTRVQIDINKSLQIINDAQQHYEDSVMFRYLRICKLQRNFQFFPMHEECKQLEMICLRDENDYYLAKTYNMLALLCQITEKEEAIPYLEKALNCFPDDAYNEDIKGFLTNIGMAYYREKRYEEATSAFERLLQNEQVLITFFFPYYYIGLLESKQTCKVEQFIHMLQANQVHASPYYKELATLFIMAYKIENTLTLRKQLRSFFRKYHADFTSDQYLVEAFQSILHKHANASKNNRAFSLYLEKVS